MGLYSKLSGLFRTNAAPPVPPPFDVISGGSSGQQQIVDPRLMLLSRVFYAPFRREDRLSLFYSIYYNQPIGQGAVNVICKSCNTEPVFRSGNPQVDRRCMEVYREINGHVVNDMLLRQGLIYGYSVGDIAYPDFQRVSHVCVPDSPLIRFVPNRYGQIEGVRQLIGTVFSSLAGPQTEPFPASRFIIYRRDPVSTFDYYGSSIYESAVDYYEAICSILQAETAVMLRLGRPRFHVKLNSEGLTIEQLKERLTQCRAIMKDLGSPTGQDVFTTDAMDISIIGAEGFAVRFTEEVRSIMSCILASCAIPPALMNVVIQGSGGAETYVRQSVLSLQSMFDRIQQGLSEAWNQSFWRLVAALEGFPIIPVMEYERPRLLEALQEAKGVEAEFSNAWTQVVAGIRPENYLGQVCDAPEIDNPQALHEAVLKARETWTGPGQTGSDETNQVQRTKDTDEKATNNNLP